MGSRARGRAATRSLRSARGAAHSEGVAADTILTGHPSSSGSGSTSKVYDRRDDIDGLSRQKVSPAWRTDPRFTLTFRQRGLAGSASNRRGEAFRYAGNSPALRKVAFAPFRDHLERCDPSASLNG